MRWIAVLAISVVGSSLSGCSYQEDYASSKAATDIFHHLVDRGEYAAIYDNSASGFQKAASRDASNKFFARISLKMGDCTESPVTFGGYQMTTSGTFITMNFSRACKNGTLDEQFVWVLENGKPVLLKYNANNPLRVVD